MNPATFTMRFSGILVVFGLSIGVGFAQLRQADSLFKALKYEQALILYGQLSKSTDPATHLKAAIGQSSCYINLRRYAEALDLIRPFYLQKQQDSLTFKVAYLASLGYMMMGKVDSAEIAYKKAQKTVPNIVFEQLRIYDLARNVSIAKYEPEKAFSASLAGLQLAEKNNEQRYIINFSQHIGDMYWARAEHRKAINTYLRTLKKVNPKGEWGQLRSIYYGLGNCYMSLNILDSAQLYLDKNYRAVVEAKDTLAMAHALGAYIILYIAQKKYALALQSTLQAKRYYEQVNQPSESARMSLYLSEIYGLKSDFAKAIKTAQEAISMSKKLHLPSLEMAGQKLLAKAFEESGNASEALKAYVAYTDLLQKQYDIEKIKLSEESAKKYEIYEKEKQLNQQKAELIANELRLRNIQLYALMTVMILGAILSFLYRSKVKAQRQLKDKEASALRELLKMNDQLAQAESFNYTVSHELKQHLSDLEYQLNLSIQEGNQVDTIKTTRRISHLNQMVSKLLDLSKLDTQPTREVEFSVNELIEEILEEKNTESKIKVNIEKLPILKTDRLLWKSVFANLIDNSLKYTSYEKTPSLWITGKRVGNGYTFWVKDNGIGFSEDAAENLFKPFQRLKHTDGTEGTGVGLVVVKKIVEKFGGTIVASSAEGQGATFAIHLPQSLLLEGQVAL